MEKLGLGLKTQTTNYVYNVPAPAPDQANATATPTNTATLRAYGGGVSLVQAGEAKTTQSVLCEAEGANGAAGFATTECTGVWSTVTK